MEHDVENSRRSKVAPEANVFTRPQAYDLADQRELMRLMREVRSYLGTCRGRHHGTDYTGRNFAIEALDRICEGEVGVALTTRHS